MAAGDIFNGKLQLTTSAQTLDTLVGAGAKTYSYVSFKKSGGVAFMGNSGVTPANGFGLSEFDELVANSGSIIGANLNLIGPGVVDFFGITSA